MKKFSMLVPLLAVLVITGCQGDEAPSAPAQVDLIFRGFYGDSPLLMYEREYPYPAGIEVKFSLFQFYLSEAVLLPADESQPPVQLTDVALVSFEDIQDEAAAERGYVIQAGDIPPGDYRGVRFGVGVAPALNNTTQPGDYEPGHPLTGNYWSWATGYVFFKIEGRADIAGDGEFAEKLTFHIGTNPYYFTKEFLRPIEVNSGKTLALNFSVDLKQVLAPAEDDFLDFRQVTQDHTTDPAVASFLQEHLAEAIRMRTE